MLVSVPEFVLLELTGDIGKRGRKGQSLEEAVHLAGTLRNLRIEVQLPLNGRSGPKAVHPRTPQQDSRRTDAL